MARSALLGIGFPESVLKFSIIDPSAPPEYDGDGRPIPPSATIVQVRVKLKPTGNPSILALTGHDVSVVHLSGLCLSPLRLPSGIKAGMVAPLTVDGTPGVFTLLPWFPSQHEAAVDAIGSRIAGTWRAS